MVGALLTSKSYFYAQFIYLAALLSYKKVHGWTSRGLRSPENKHETFCVFPNEMVRWDLETPPPHHPQSAQHLHQRLFYRGTKNHFSTLFDFELAKLLDFLLDLEHSLNCVWYSLGNQ